MHLFCFQPFRAGLGWTRLAVSSRRNIFLTAAALGVGGCLSLVTPLSAQTTTPRAEDAAAAAQAMRDGLEFRSGLADAVAKGTLNAEEAVSRLRTRGRVTGLPVDPDADFAYGAMDLGRRLAARQPDVAIKLFEAAEQSLDAVIQRTSDAAAKNKAHLLCQLAIIRSTYLGKAPQSRRDIDRAIALQPEDGYLKQARGVMANSHAEQFRAGAEGGQP